MNCLKTLTTYERAVFASLAVLVATLTLVLLNIGFQAPVLT